MVGKDGVLGVQEGSPGLKKEIQWGEREVEDVAKRGLKEGRIGNREMLRI